MSIWKSTRPRENLDHSKYESWGFTDSVVTEGPGTPTADGAMVFVCRGTCGMLKLVNPPKDGPRYNGVVKEDSKYFEEVGFDVRSTDCNAEVARRLDERKRTDIDRIKSEILRLARGYYGYRDLPIDMEIAVRNLLQLERPCQNPCSGPDRCDQCTRALVDAKPFGVIAETLDIIFGCVDVADPKGTRKLKDVPTPPPHPGFTMQEIAASFEKAKVKEDDHGICRHCGGIVHPVYPYHEDFWGVVLGPPPPRSISSWNCESCHVMYANKPVRTLATKRGHF